MATISRDIRQFRDYIRAVTEELRWKFYVNEYELSFVWDEENPKIVQLTETGHVCLRAAIKIDDVYLKFTVFCYKDLFMLWKENNLKELYETLLHEYCHLLTEPLFNQAHDYCPRDARNLVNDIRERQTERMKNVVMHSDFKTVPWKKKVISKRKKQ